MSVPMILAIDQGTTGTTVLAVDHAGTIRSRGYAAVEQVYPRPGWVEHDPLQIWQTVLDATAQALAPLPSHRLVAIGVTNQRETTVVWDRHTGEPCGPAIVWQCRRTARRCDELRAAGQEGLFLRRTGLILDAYFSGTKVEWLLHHIPGLRTRAEAGAAIFGTVDSWVLWNLTGGATHATDVSNASRTLLLEIDGATWDPELCGVLDVPLRMLPRVSPSCALIGESAGAGPFPAGVPVAGVAGDQQAALFGQGCLSPGDAKITYGTGCFLLLNTGDRRVESGNQLLSTIAWRLGEASPLQYALEGSVFTGGSVVQWLRDELGLIDTAAETAALAMSVRNSADVVFVPAFTGLGAPYWDQDARGVISGLTRGATKAHLVRAALEGVAHQVADVVEAMERDSGAPLGQIAVDGGAAANDFLMQFQADLLGCPVVRPVQLETTALGAAYLAGLGVGFWSSPQEVAAGRAAGDRFQPTMGRAEREERRAAWRRAVERVRCRP